MSKVSISIKTSLSKSKYQRINDENDEINCCDVNVCCSNPNSSIYDKVSFVTEDDELTKTVIAGKFKFQINLTNF